MLIIGLGDSGCNALLDLHQEWPEHPPFLAINSESFTPPDSAEIKFILIGSHQLRGQGTGGDPRLGLLAMEESLPELRDALKGVDLVLLVTGLGGGTGTGAAPVIMTEARKAGALSLALTMLPFSWESGLRQERAQQGFLALREVADGVVALPCQRLLADTAGETKIEHLFACAQKILFQSLRVLWIILEKRGVINVSFADLRELVCSGNGYCTIAVADSAGEQKAFRVAESLKTHPLLDGGKALQKARSVLLSLAGGPDLTLLDVKQISEHLGLNESVHNLVLTGLIIDPALQDRLLGMIFLAEDGEKYPGHKAEKKNLKQSALTAAQLNLFEYTDTGKFEDTEPTIMNSENLDIPTFMRRHLQIKK